MAKLNFGKHLLSALIGGGVGAGLALLWAKRATTPPPPTPAKAPPAAINTAGADGAWVSNWGNYPQIKAQVHYFETVPQLRALLEQLPHAIARGNGRCYGDSALAEDIISTLQFNKFLGFDQQQGQLHCQAGVKLDEILEVIVPQGWFLPVTPGTKLITVGGAIASNVHGKSQHKAGNFGDHLAEIELMQADGQVITCSPTENADLFWATCGGMGLTGIILSAKMRLIPIETAYFRQESVRAENLDHMMDLFEESEAWMYSVAWIDCLTKGHNMGRGFIMRGDHATVEDLAGDNRRQQPLKLKWKPKLVVPFNFPEFFLNGLTVKLFNFVLFHTHPKGRVRSIVDYNSFFYPLDAIYSWNRIYGRRGFTQYQFVLPKAQSRAGLRAIMQKIAERNMGSFLTVLKLYREQTGYLPFSVDGYSLALDFPIRDNLFAFLDELDELVLEYGGRLYLTKDARMSETMFKETYPQLERFKAQMPTMAGNYKFRSLQSDRIGLT